MKTQTIDAKLLFAQNAIQNALNTEAIKTVLAEFGYDEAKLNEGLALCATATDLHQKQKKEYGDQFAATDGLHIARATANKPYMRHVKLARVALKKDRGAYESLQLSGGRKTSNSGWLQQAKTFYANALSSPEILEKLTPLSMNEQVLQTAQQQVIDVEGKYNSQLKEKGEAQAATQVRDDAFEVLQEWMHDFMTIARIALEDQTQLLEVLGVVEYS